MILCRPRKGRAKDSEEDLVGARFFRVDGLLLDRFWEQRPKWGEQEGIPSVSVFCWFDGRQDS